MSRRRARARRRVRTAGAAAGLCAAAILATGLAPAAPGAGASTGQVTGLGTGATWASAQGSWAAVPMGHLDSATNTFWQLLYRAPGATRWTLATPPGVASNGGIVAVDTAASPGTVTAGFQPTKLLRYSPVARTANGGRTWATGVIPDGLSDVADAMATGSDGDALALVRTRGGTVVRSEGSLTRWQAVVSEPELAATSAGRACGLDAVDAVAVAAGADEVGAGCTAPGVVGIFTDASGTWTSAGPTVASEASRPMTVLRLQATPGGGTVALVQAGGGSRAALVALWRSGTGTWRASAPRAIDGSVLSAGVGPGGSLVVLTGHGWRSDAVLTIGGPGGRWRAAANPPARTQAVVGGSGPLTALAASGSKVTVWTADGGRWARSQRFTVPVQYGSST